MPMIDGKYRRPQLRNGKINYRFGWFFVTFQVFENKSLLGAIVGENCILNELGLAVKGLIETLPKYNPEVYVDCFVVMPNHVHLVLKIDDRPTNEEHHLGKIMRKLKSLAAREYRILGSRGVVPCLGTKLWQENYWEKIVTSHDQLEAIRRYIANNPKRWSTDRFGPVTTFSRGNLALLDEPFVAFVASQVARGDALAPREWARGDALAPREWAAGHDGPAPQDGGLAPRDEAPQDLESLGERGCDPPLPPPVISTFTSPQEREALRRLLAKKRRIIAVYPGGIPAVLPPAIAESVDAGRMLLLSPVESGTGVNKQRAIWCNEYVIRRAKKVWCGTITPGGTLESILKGTMQ